MHKRMLLWFIIGVFIDKASKYLILKLEKLIENNDFSRLFPMPYSWIFTNLIIIVGVIIAIIVKGNYTKSHQTCYISSLVLGNLISGVVLIISAMIVASSL